MNEPLSSLESATMRRRELIAELRATHDEGISAKIESMSAESLDERRLRFLMQEWLSLSDRLTIPHAELRRVTGFLEEEQQSPHSSRCWVLGDGRGAIARTSRSLVRYWPKVG